MMIIAGDFNNHLEKVSKAFESLTLKRVVGG